jgi:hypothetical protein
MKRIVILILVLQVLFAHATDYYLSLSTGDNNNPGTALSPWKTVKFYGIGNRYFLKRGDVWPGLDFPKLNTNPSQQISLDAYGTGAKPLISFYTTIKPSAWSLYLPNVWVATLTSSVYTSGYLPTASNCGFLMADGNKFGQRRTDPTRLVNQWEFYCDFANKIYVYSSGNPSFIADEIKVSNSNRQFVLSNYMSVQNIDVEANASAGWFGLQVSYINVRNCKVSYCGGEMKKLTDSVRQGNGITFYNGGTSINVDGDSVIGCYDEAFSWQLHASGPTGISYKDCNFVNCYADSCEASFNPSQAVLNGHGYINCHVEYNTFKHDGYSWSHFARPNNNEAVALLINYWLEIASERQVYVRYNTIICPREGLYYLTQDAPDPKYTSNNNTIYISPNIPIRKNFRGGFAPFPYKLNDPVYNQARFTLDLGYEVNSNWFACIEVPASVTYYQDFDGDSYGNDAVTDTSSFGAPAGYVLIGKDCNDSDATIYPNAPELLDGKDNNCDGLIDVQYTYYRDADGDGYGNPTDTIVSSSPTPPVGYVTDNSDCDDTNALTHPGAAEISDGLDNNCDGRIDEGCLIKRI